MGFRSGRGGRRRLTRDQCATQALLVEHRPLQYALEMETMKNYRAAGHITARQATCENTDNHSTYIEDVLCNNKQSYICQSFHLFSVDAYFRWVKYKIQHGYRYRENPASGGVQLCTDDPKQEAGRHQRPDL